MTTAQQNFIKAQQNLVLLAKEGKRVYDGRYQAAVQNERVTKTALISEQMLNLKTGYLP